jgi:hypothetical protein
MPPLAPYEMPDDFEGQGISRITVPTESAPKNNLSDFESDPDDGDVETQSDTAQLQTDLSFSTDIRVGRDVG